MVLEALAAISLASAVVQLVEFTTKVVSKGHEYQKSVDGAIKEHIELNEYAENFSRLSQHLTNATMLLPPQDRLSEDETSLLAVAKKCQATCREIIATIDCLQKPRHQKRFASLRLASRAVWNEEKIELCLQKLRLAREELIVHLLVVINNQQGGVEDLITRTNQRVEANLLKAVNASRKQISAQIRDLVNTLSKVSSTQRGPLLAEWREKIDISDVEDVFLKASEADDRDRATQLLLDSLFFEQMSDRHETIAKAHATTFQWIFDQQPSQVIPWTNFASWLSEADQQDGLYWITDKPGSGKSTLMRFLFDNPRIKKHLKRWAKSHKLILASCFFWHSGELIQKSQEGLLRSLLFQLFSQVPRLIEIACSWRWRSYMAGALRLGSWTNQQLLNALHSALKNLLGIGKAAIFIDGLDEYEGGNDAHSDLIEFVKTLSQTPNIKICVSSRPWVAFKSAFEQGPSLQLHHLTHQDIKNYINQKLLITDLFIKLKISDATSCSQLALEIHKKAKGVFLWVYLVVRALGMPAE